MFHIPLLTVSRHYSTFSFTLQIALIEYQFSGRFCLEEAILDFIVLKVYTYLFMIISTHNCYISWMLHHHFCCAYFIQYYYRGTKSTPERNVKSIISPRRPDVVVNQERGVGIQQVTSPSGSASTETYYT